MINFLKFTLLTLLTFVSSVYSQEEIQETNSTYESPPSKEDLERDAELQEAFERYKQTGVRDPRYSYGNDVEINIHFKNSSGSDGSSEGSNSGSGTGNQGSSQIATKDSKSEKKYSRIISKLDGSSDFGGSGGENRSGNASTIGSNSRSTEHQFQSKTYTALVSKGKFAEGRMSNEKRAQNTYLSIDLGRYSSLFTQERLSQVYGSSPDGTKLFSDSKSKRVADLFISIVKYNQQNLFPIISSNLDADNFKYQEYKQKLLNRELQQLFPEIHQKNVQEIIQARKIIENWKIADRAIGSSIFKSEFMQIDSAVQTIQNSVDQMGLGPVESSLMTSIDQFQQNSLMRMHAYISNFIEDMASSPNYDTGESQKKFAIEKLQSAFNSIYLQGDYFQAANDITEAKAVLQYTGPLEEPFIDPVDFIASAGIIPLTRGLTRYGVKEILINVVTAEERSIVRRALTQYVDNGITVLGKVGHYEEFGQKIGARVFDIGEIWTKFSTEEKWLVNKKFLDIGINRGDRFILSRKVTDIHQVDGFLRREIDYLYKKGYKLSLDGRELIK
jgi:hypothetical protein